MRHIGLSEDGRMRSSAATSSTLKWSARLAAFAILACLAFAAYIAAAESALSALEKTKSDLEISLSAAEKKGQKNGALEARAMRVASMRRELADTFNPQPVFAALCMALRPDVCVKSLELANEGFTRKIMEMSGIEAQPASDGAAYELRLSLCAESGQAGEGFIGDFCQKASEMYAGHYAFRQIQITEGEELVVSGKPFRLYEASISIETQKGREADERR